MATRELCRHASAIHRGQPTGGRLRTCALGLHGGQVTRLGACRTCASHETAAGVSPPAPAAPRRTPLAVIRSACVHEGAIVESCHTCAGDAKSVRDCDLHDRCTRVVVSDKMRSCATCADYRPMPN